MQRPRFRPRLTISLRALMLLVLLVSIGMSWLAVRMERARKQWEAVEAIERLGGSWLDEEACLTRQLGSKAYWGTISSETSGMWTSPTPKWWTPTWNI